MPDFPALFPGTAGADFSAVLSLREWVFGFVAYREHTELLLGDETRWLALPSWLTLVLFAALALSEWALLRWLGKLFAVRWRR